MHIPEDSWTENLLSTRALRVIDALKQTELQRYKSVKMCFSRGLHEYERSNRGTFVLYSTRERVYSSPVPRTAEEAVEAMDTQKRYKRNSP